MKFLIAMKKYKFQENKYVFNVLTPENKSIIIKFKKNNSFGSFPPYENINFTEANILNGLTIFLGSFLTKAYTNVDLYENKKTSILHLIY